MATTPDESPSHIVAGHKMASSSSESDRLREQFIIKAELFARAMKIPYDKIGVSKKRGFVSFKIDSDGSGGWSEGTPAVSIPSFIITNWYDHTATEVRKASINELKACLRNVPMPSLSYEQVQNRITELQSESDVSHE